MQDMRTAIPRNAKIAIIGAGPAGLSTAWFLGKHGYRNVTVLEKLGRVGGLCKSITIDGRNFDLGANYLTWDYQETLALARAVGAKTYAEKPYTSLHIHGYLESANYRDIKTAVLFNYYTNKKVSVFSFLVAALRYLRIRWKLSGLIDSPGYLDKIHQHASLCVSFKDWLETNRLMPLSAMFQFPITVMGYGKLEDIATPYALRYMSLRTVFPMVFSSWLLKLFIGHWPKRFVDGFQRFWERVAWQTNVRLNVDIKQINRQANDGKIAIQLEYPEQYMNQTSNTTATLNYDYLILACPLTPDVFDSLGLEKNPGETEITRKILFNPYCMTTYWVDNMQMPQPIAPAIPVPPDGIPTAIARQFQSSGTLFSQFYTCPAELGQNLPAYQFTFKQLNQKPNPDNVDKNVKRLIKLLGGTISEGQAHWQTYDVFTYFQHFSVEDIKQGIYATLADMQGHDRTFYVGGATDFELIEPIIKHSRYIVEKHFLGRSFAHG